MAIGFTLAGLGAAVLGAALLASTLSGAGPRRVGMWLLVVGVGALGAGIWFGWLRPRRVYRDDRNIARWVGRGARPLASDLLSAVELRAGEDQPDGPYSRVLVRSLLDQVAKQVDTLEPDELLPPSPAVRAQRALIAVGALWALAVVLAPGRVARGWDRMLHAPPPGPFGGAAVVDSPLVGDLHVTLVFPEYSGRAPLDIPSSSGDFRAMPGTQVHMETTALLDARAARVVFGQDDAGEVVEMTVDGNRLGADLVVGDQDVYRFLIEDERGDRHVERTGRRIEIEEDQAPRVELYAPAEELDVSAMKRIELAWTGEDDYGLAKVELVIEPPGAAPMRRPVPKSLGDGVRRSAQGKFLWDLAEVDIQPGTRVAYHLEITDNCTVDGANVGKSREYHLRVFSPRERHERLMERQRQLFEHVLALLGDRLVVDADALDAHDALQRMTSDAVVEIGGLAAALGEDRMASPKLVAALTAMRQRLEALSRGEARLLAQVRKTGGKPGTRLAASDKLQVGELEDDTLILADWLDRQQLELMLAIADEIAGHKDRLRELFKEYKRTGSEALRKEIERELRALEQKLAELAAKRGGMAADVLDEFVNRDAMEMDADAASCTAEVRKLLAAGDAEAAQKKMEECAKELDAAAGALEQSLESLRGDRFSEQEKRFEELRNELADLTKDQSDIAEGADRLWQRYAERADDLMRDQARETREKVGDLIERLEKQVTRVPADGLTQFSTEELALVKKRIEDVREMLGDGDIAEALAMAKQAEAGLETIEEELAAALEEEDDDSPWARRTGESLKSVKKARPMARKLIDQLEQSLPSPDEIMDPGDRKEMDKLRRRQQQARERARRLAGKAQQFAGEMPGTAGEEMQRGLDEAGEPMERAAEDMRTRDPSGARHEARQAAELLEQTQKNVRGAARQQERSGRNRPDEPVRIPGAEEYRPPEEFREQLLEAMKKEQAPDGYGELVRRYYEELIK